MSSKHPTPQPRDIVRESFYFQTFMRNKNGIEHTVLLYEDGTMRKQAREPERLPKKPPTEPVRRKFDFDP